MTDLKSRIRGCLLGGAVGDALGAPLEFTQLREIVDRWGPEGPKELEEGENHPAGEFTDDTQMTLFTAEGLIRAQNRGNLRGICNPATVVAHSYWRWLKTQGERPDSDSASDELLTSWLTDVPGLNVRRAPGNTCCSALRSGRIGTTDEPINGSKGCGGVMRVAPVGFVRYFDPFKLGCESAAVTHGHTTGWLASGALSLIITRLTAGEHLRDAVLDAMEVCSRYPRHHETTDALRHALVLAEENNGSPQKVEELGAGWVAEQALAISVYCAMVALDFESAVRLAVTHSGDSDSTGSITGQILGTVHGDEAIPGRWLAALKLRDVVEQVAADLFHAFHDPAALAPEGAFDWERYPGT